MSYIQGVAIRNTAGYVTDGANDWGETTLATDYPATTTQGNKVGLESGVNWSNRDRNAAIDPRLAGMGYTNNNVTATIRFDITAGTKNIRLAAGDYNYASGALVEIFDTTTSLGVVISTATTAGDRFRDATDVEYSSANWPGSNTAISKTFSTTICRFTIGTTANSTLYAIAYMYVEDAGGSTTAWKKLANLGPGQKPGANPPLRAFKQGVPYGANVTVALTGQSVAASAGTLVSAIAYGLSGQAVAGSAGTFVPNLSAVIAGQPVTASAGTVGGNVDYTIAGQAVTASSGTLVPNIAYGLTGSAVTASTGTLTATANDVTVALSGQAVTASAGTLTPSITASINGQDVIVSAGTLTPLGGDQPIIPPPLPGGAGFVRGNKRKKAGPVMRDGQVFGEAFPISPFMETTKESMRVGEVKRLKYAKITKASPIVDHSERDAVVLLLQHLL